MNYGLSDQVRSVAVEKYVDPAVHADKTHFSIPVRELMEDLRARGFPSRNWPQVCSAIQSNKFLRANGLEIEAVDGPPSGQSTTVVVRYRVAAVPSHRAANPAGSNREQMRVPDETPEEWAHRMTGKLLGLMKKEIAAHGGAERYIRWVRSEEEDSE